MAKTKKGKPAPDSKKTTGGFSQIVSANMLQLDSSTGPLAAFTILTVTVNGGITPLSILAALYQDGNRIMNFSASSSFTHLFGNLVPGSNYDLTIGGFNPAGGNTVCSLTTDQIVLTPSSDKNPSDPLTGTAFRVDFNFNVQ